MVIVGIGAIVAILMSESLVPILPVAIGLGLCAGWLTRRSWPIVTEAWEGFPVENVEQSPPTPTLSGSAKPLLAH